MKLAIVGGGSTYTPELIDGFARLRDTLPVEELWLVDPDPSRLELVAGIAQRMFARAGHPGRVIGTGDLVAGVSDADAVLIQLRIGGQDARRGDETWPHEVHCIGQETTGPGGFAKALRTVPVVLKVADAVRAHAKPDAWIVDFTNPVGIVTRALLNEGHRAVGLCNVAIGFQRRFAGMLGVAPDDIMLGHVGLNHLTWIRSVTAGGVDHLPSMFEDLETLADEVELPAHLLQLIGAVPSYYLRYYYAHDEVLEEQLHSPTRADAVQAVERELLALYADPSVDTKPAALEQRGGAYYSEAAIELLSGLIGGVDQTRVVNLRNGSSLPFLPEDHVIEVPARVSAAGVEALPIAPLADDMRGLISAVAGYERLALDAAIHGGRDRVVRAMQAHPLVLQYDRAEKLTDLLLQHNAQHLEWGSMTVSRSPAAGAGGLIVGVDGGGSKTHAVALTLDGALVGRAEGAGSSPHIVGVDRSIEIVDAAVRQALGGAVAAQSNVYLSGLDLDSEVRTYLEAVARLEWAGPDVVVENDLWALLRAGTQSPDAVAVVCGTGINAVGVRADGATARFAALGPISGDWGGGSGLGEEALWHAARAEDGRGPETLLRAAVLEGMHVATVRELTEQLHFGARMLPDLAVLAPAVFDAARAGDAVAIAVVDRQAAEVVSFARAALTRLDLLGADVPVVLGGGVIRARDQRLLDGIMAGLAADAPRASIVIVNAPPIVGAGLLALESAGATRAALDRARKELSS